MLLARDNNYNNLEIYISFLSQIIEKESKEYKLIFDQIVRNVNAIANKQKTYSDIPPETFDIVSFFAFNHENFFKSIDPDKVTKENYGEMLKFLKTDLHHA